MAFYGSVCVLRQGTAQPQGPKPCLTHPGTWQTMVGRADNSLCLSMAKPLSALNHPFLPYPILQHLMGQLSKGSQS